jgi:hypothetical protein
MSDCVTRGKQQQGAAGGRLTDTHKKKVKSGSKALRAVRGDGVGHVRMTRARPGSRPQPSKRFLSVSTILLHSVLNNGNGSTNSGV